MIRRTTVLATSAALTLSAAVGAYASDSPSVQRADYLGAALQAGVLYAGFTVADQQVAAASLLAPEGVHAVTVDVMDATSGNVLFDLMQRDQQGQEKVLGTFCSTATTVPLLRDSAPVVVRVYTGRCPTGVLSVPTRGSAVATFQ